MSWILYELTNSPLLLGLSGVFRALPVIVLGLFGGAIADRVPRRPLLMFTESTMLIAIVDCGSAGVERRLAVLAPLYPERCQRHALGILGAGAPGPVRGARAAHGDPERGHIEFLRRAQRRPSRSLDRRVRAGLWRLCAAVLSQCCELSRIIFALMAMRLPSVAADASLPRLPLARGMTEGLALSGAMRRSKSSWASNSSAVSSATTARSSPSSRATSWARDPKAWGCCSARLARERYWAWA